MWNLFSKKISHAWWELETPFPNVRQQSRHLTHMSDQLFSLQEKKKKRPRWCYVSSLKLANNWFCFWFFFFFYSVAVMCNVACTAPPIPDKTITLFSPNHFIATYLFHVIFFNSPLYLPCISFQNCLTICWWKHSYWRHSYWLRTNKPKEFNIKLWTVTLWLTSFSGTASSYFMEGNRGSAEACTTLYYKVQYTQNIVTWHH